MIKPFTSSSSLSSRRLFTPVEPPDMPGVGDDSDACANGKTDAEGLIARRALPLLLGAGVSCIFV